ncbi:unnamed protein product [Bursaphelenchus okinawaensis]|uniref:ShKT domain-containing protein n=1 Tax=Bursaphelenchus okinawaensis TaxID=465554 RepID=A0A811L1M0_9BILA|nr:unnamed protein product [Bursaphelenchus okinawaensis]CAG9115238.1 unnamed protein product [Bursaphelenchus okinawaensis]
MDNCVDEPKANCDRSDIKSVCNHPMYKRLMNSNCRKACGMCQPGTCTDTTTDCSKPSISGVCSHPTYKRLMSKKCPVTCSACDGNDSNPSNPSNPNSPDSPGGDDECINGAAD